MRYVNAPALRRVAFTWFAAISALFVSAPVRGDIIFFDNQGSFSSNPNNPGTEQVHFNQVGAVVGPAPTVTGVTNQSGHLVNIASNPPGPTQNFTIQGMSINAEVNAQDGAFAGATISPGDFDTFTALGFALRFNDANSTDEVKITAVRDNGSSEDQTFVIGPGQGNRFFGVISFNGQLLKSVTVSTNSANELQALHQIEIGGFNGNSNNDPQQTDPVPEPASLIIWGVGAVAVGGFLRCRRRRNRSLSI